ncbi:MAG: glucosamine-6-phosphate deaminase [Clostridia bacterium]|nr:glucosamine-6-phosphate deaminase [Clostridia bacterium]
MKVIVTKNYEEMSARAFEIMKEVVVSNPKAVLGLATGSTPIGLYDCMAEDHQKNGTSYKDIRTVNLDEYLGIGIESDQSYVYFMRKYLFSRVDIDLANTNLPNGKAEDPEAECARYNALLKTLPQDIQLLGIGSNGHIGFNEPGTPFDSVTHVVALAESTIRDNARLFEDPNDVPKKALSMGIANILDAKKVLILASGANKAKAVYGMVKAEPDVNCPASALQNHPDVIVIVDEAAASLL